MSERPVDPLAQSAAADNEAAKAPPEAIVIGAGINGLACAAYLARAGRRVLVLESRDRIGGMAANERFGEGITASACAHLMSQFHPALIRELGLYGQGLAYSHRRIPTVLLARDGRHILISDDEWASAASIARHSEPDGERYRALMRQLAVFADAIDPVLTTDPPVPGGEGASHNRSVRHLTRALRAMGESQFSVLTRMGMASVATLLDHYFETPLLKGGLAFDALRGSFADPFTPGTSLNFLASRIGEVSGIAGAYAHPEGGMGSLAEALWGVAEASGARLRLDAPVAGLLVRDGSVSGVRIDTGEEIVAGLVVSSLDPGTTLLHLASPRNLDIGVNRALQRLSSRGSVARLTFITRGMPEIRGLDEPGHQCARFVIAPGLDALREAYVPAKYGELPAAPAVEFIIPSVHDRSLAPDEVHVVTALALHVPYCEEETDERRQALAERVIEAITAHAPDFRRRVRASHVLMPRDIEQRYGAPGGQWHHTELLPDQLYSLRPFAGARGYATPLENLFLCGAGTHPGGGVTGLPGRNAARQILEMRGWGP